MGQGSGLRLKDERFGFKLGFGGAWGEDLLVCIGFCGVEVEGLGCQAEGFRVVSEARKVFGDRVVHWSGKKYYENFMGLVSEHFSVQMLQSSCKNCSTEPRGARVRSIEPVKYVLNRRSRLKLQQLSYSLPQTKTVHENPPKPQTPGTGGKRFPLLEFWATTGCWVTDGIRTSGPLEIGKAPEFTFPEV